jgi:hypothetical protein
MTFTSLPYMSPDIQKAYTIEDTSILDSPVGDGFHLFEIMFFYACLNHLKDFLTPEYLLNVMRRMREVLYPPTSAILTPEEEQFTNDVMAAFLVPRRSYMMEVKKRIISLVRADPPGAQVETGRRLLAAAVKDQVKNVTRFLSSRNLSYFMMNYLEGGFLFDNPNQAISALYALIAYFDSFTSTPGRVSKALWIEHFITTLRKSTLAVEICYFHASNKNIKVRNFEHHVCKAGPLSPSAGRIVPATSITPSPSFIQPSSGIMPPQSMFSASVSVASMPGSAIPAKVVPNSAIPSQDVYGSTIPAPVVPSSTIPRAVVPSAAIPMVVVEPAPEQAEPVFNRARPAVVPTSPSSAKVDLFTSSSSPYSALARTPQNRRNIFSHSLLSFTDNFKQPTYDVSQHVVHSPHVIREHVEPYALDDASKSPRTPRTVPLVAEYFAPAGGTGRAAVPALFDSFLRMPPPSQQMPATPRNEPVAPTSPHQAQEFPSAVLRGVPFGLPTVSPPLSPTRQPGRLATFRVTPSPNLKQENAAASRRESSPGLPAQQRDSTSGLPARRSTGGTDEHLFESLEKTRDLVYKSLVKAGMSPDRSTRVAAQFTEGPEDVEALRRAVKVERSSNPLQKFDSLMQRAEASVNDGHKLSEIKAIMAEIRDIAKTQ